MRGGPKGLDDHRASYGTQLQNKDNSFAVPSFLSQHDSFGGNQKGSYSKNKGSPLFGSSASAGASQMLPRGKGKDNLNFAPGV